MAFIPSLNSSCFRALIRRTGHVFLAAGVSLIKVGTALEGPCELHMGLVVNLDLSINQNALGMFIAGHNIFYISVYFIYPSAPSLL